MTGVVDVYLMLTKGRSEEASQRLSSLFQRKQKSEDLQKFIVLSWKHTGSNLLCSILHSHPKLSCTMSFPIQLTFLTYHPASLLQCETQKDKWNYVSRYLYSRKFLDHIWTGCYIDGKKIKPSGRAIGFKSFPDHWKDIDNEAIWK